MVSNVTVYNNLLKPRECDHLILDHTYHTHHEWVFQNPSLAEKLWKRLQKLKYPFSQTKDEFNTVWEVVGLDSEFHLTKHYPGEKLQKCMDTCHQPTYNLRGFASLTIYLNDTCRGGDTHFTDYGIRVAPQKGRAFLYLVDKNMYESDTVVEGCKYMLRGNVMYQPASNDHQNMRLMHFEARKKAMELDVSGSQEESEIKKLNDLWMYTYHLENLLYRKNSKK